jgi:hypothetical protein
VRCRLTIRKMMEMESLARHGLGRHACMHARICALWTGPVQTTSRCQTDRPSQRRQRSTIFWTGVRRYCTAASRSALRHANDYPLHAVHTMQAASRILQRHWLDPCCSCLSRGTAAFDLSLRSSLAVHRGSHCVALQVRLYSRVGRSMSQARHAGAKPHKERGKRRSRQWDCELLCELSFASSTYVYLSS